MEKLKQQEAEKVVEKEKKNELDRDINTIAVDLDDILQALQHIINNLDEATGSVDANLNDAEYFLGVAKEALDKARNS